MSDARVVLVSGGSRGLGASLVQDFLRQGHSVATFSRKKTDLVISIENSYPGRFKWVQFSSDQFDMLNPMIKEVLSYFGRIDVLINNAAIASEGVLSLMPSNRVREVVDVNLTGLILLSKHISRIMLHQEKGVIINIGSITSISGFAGLSVYSATKAGIVGFTKALARELGPKGIRVNTVSPGFLKTDMSESLSESQQRQILRRTPLRRLGKVDDVIGIINFLISEQASFITGQTFIVDGGLTC